jgi:predicted nucleic acid-binding protein
MKLVLDASVAAKILLPEADSAQAEALMRDFQNKVHDLIAPDILPVEIGHTLTRAERIGTLKQGEAIQKLTQFLLIRPPLFPYLPLLPRAVELSSQARIGVYDAIYCALCEQEQCELVTTDQKLINSAKVSYIRLLSSI